MIPTFKPSIIRKDMDSVLTCMVDEALAFGDVSRDFLKKLSQELSFNSVYGLKEYQRGLETLLKASELEKGKKIGLSPLSPAWYLRVIEDSGYIPIFLDVDPDTCTLKMPQGADPEETADLFLVYHHLGYETELSWARESGVPIIEDLSQIIANRLIPGKETAHAPLGFFSLSDQDYLTALGGVFLFAGEKKEGLLLKAAFDRLDTSQYLTDPQAALGASQWSRLEKFSVRRKELRTIFLNSLQKSRNKTFAVPDEETHIPYSFPVLLNSGAKEAAVYARKKKILCTPAFENSILAANPDLPGDFPGSRSLLLRCVLFPLYPSLSSGDVDLIAKVLSTLP